jgi:hypothetical protein
MTNDWLQNSSNDAYGNRYNDRHEYSDKDRYVEPIMKLSHALGCNLDLLILDPSVLRDLIRISIQMLNL